MIIEVEDRFCRVAEAFSQVLGKLQRAAARGVSVDCLQDNPSRPIALPLFEHFFRIFSGDSTAPATTLELPPAATGTWIVTPYANPGRRCVERLLAGILHDLDRTWCRHI